MIPRPLTTSPRAAWSARWAWIIGIASCWPIIFLREDFARLFWFGDEWDLLDQIWRTGFWDWMWQAFAENFVPLFKLLWYGSVVVGNGDYRLVMGAMWLTHAVNVALLGLLLREAGFRWVTAAAVMIGFGFTSTNLETLGWSVQWSAVLATGFFLAAAWWMLRRLAVNPAGSTRDLLVLGALCAASALCFSRGVLTGSALAVIALWPASGNWFAQSGLRLRNAATAFAPGLAVAILILITQPGGNHAHLGEETDKLVEMARYAAWYYGMNPFHRLFDISSWGWRTTLLITIGKIALTIWALRRARGGEAWLCWLLVIFDLGNALLLGLGRYHTGLETANSSRYQYASLICTLPLLAVAVERVLDGLPGWGGRQLRTAVAVIALVILTWGVTRRWAFEIRWFAHSRGQVPRDLLFTDPSPPAEGAVPGIPFLRTDRAKQLIEHYNLH